MSISYKDAGVDVERGYKAVQLIREHAEKTFDENVITDLGSFAGMYEIGGGQVLVAGTDGVGTKLKAAFALDTHNTIGIDCVAMCVNDVICLGAKPLFFLDYLATGRLVPEVMADVVEGISAGCISAGCALIGGETAEMPGFYKDGEYDLAGFCVGIMDKEKAITGKHIVEGDVLVGIASSGIHSNGFSLVRKLYDMNETLKSTYFDDEALSDMFLEPTKIYVKPVLQLMEDVQVKGLAHITGGGFVENLPRMLPDGLQAEVQLGGWEIPGVFRMMLEESQITEKTAYETFNMGIGMVAVVDEKDAEQAITSLEKSGEKAYVIGKVTKGDKGAVLCK